MYKSLTQLTLLLILILIIFFISYKYFYTKDATNELKYNHSIITISVPIDPYTLLYVPKLLINPHCPFEQAIL